MKVIDGDYGMGAYLGLVSLYRLNTIYIVCFHKKFVIK
jgi:hypothetical protein